MGRPSRRRPVRQIRQRAHKYLPLDALELREIEKPAVKQGEILLRVRAAGVNPLDWHYAKGEPYLARIAIGLSGPKDRVRGVDVAGIVEAVGANVRRFQPGDEVFGWCTGSFAEYVCASEDNFVAKPAKLTFEQAAAIPVAAVTALQALRDVAHVHAGQTVLINGAAGGVGTFAVQIAKYFGAEVTGVCSTRNVELVGSIGADHVIDYAQEDYTRSGHRYDVIFDNVGNHSLSDCLRALTPKGVLITNSGTGGRWLGPLGRAVMAILLARLAGRRVRTFLAKITHEDLVALTDLAESAKLRSIIDRTYPLNEAAEAIGYVEAGHARGKVVITT